MHRLAAGSPPTASQIRVRSSRFRQGGHSEAASGRLTLGVRLPSMRELQKQYTVSSLTARSALNLLRIEGLADTVPGRGTFVVTPSLAEAAA
ncbi:GntR family transcriptional regulator [Streptomyces exfoliatus]|uniref:GntR family transcriptional regulator n=1 Tax=Streptomyces exfoliatus TaxID=1905 RepID=UPI00248031F6|nr:GntR family transcriptional regulator [Streptomyces exfoliatus]